MGEGDFGPCAIRLVNLAPSRHRGIGQNDPWSHYKQINIMLKDYAQCGKVRLGFVKVIQIFFK